MDDLTQQQQHTHTLTNNWFVFVLSFTTIFCFYCILLHLTKSNEQQYINLSNECLWFSRNTVELSTTSYSINLHYTLLQKNFYLQLAQLKDTIIVQLNSFGVNAVVSVFFMCCVKENSLNVKVKIDLQINTHYTVCKLLSNAIQQLFSPSLNHLNSMIGFSFRLTHRHNR